MRVRPQCERARKREEAGVDLKKAASAQITVIRAAATTPGRSAGKARSVTLTRRKANAVNTLAIGVSAGRETTVRNSVAASPAFGRPALGGSVATVARAVWRLGSCWQLSNAWRSRQGKPSPPLNCFFRCGQITARKNVRDIAKVNYFGTFSFFRRRKGGLYNGTIIAAH